MTLRHIINIEDLRAAARRRLPRVVFDYLDGGAEDEITLRANIRSFQDVLFRPRYAVPLPSIDLQTTVLGTPISFPALLAPIGYSRLMHPGGECAAAHVAGENGTGYILSTISGHRLEDVKAATTGPAWFQLYVIAGRDTAETAIVRARKAGFSALVATIDTPVAGMRERDYRNGMVPLLTGSAFSKLRYAPQLLLHPRWLSGFLMDGGIPALPNVVVPGKGPMPLMDVGASLARAALRWEDFKWIHNAWGGPIVVKGVLTKEDAMRSVDAGAAAIVVSNHGGRQLDSAVTALDALPEVLDAVAGRAEVLVDGGIRRGGDIVKALCLGARAVLIGRAYAYGLAAAGDAGIRRALEILRTDTERTLKLLGCKSVLDLNASYIRGNKLGAIPSPEGRGWPEGPGEGYLI